MSGRCDLASINKVLANDVYFFGRFGIGDPLAEPLGVSPLEGAFFARAFSVATYVWGSPPMS